MKKSIIYITLLFFVCKISAQSDIDNRNALQSMNSLNGSGVWIPAKSNEKIILGSVYLFPNWIGQYKVITKSGTTTNLFNLNYNVKDQTIESSVSNDSVFQYDSDKIDYILHDKNKYKVLDDGGLKGLCLEICNTTKVKVYKSYSISVTTGSTNPLTQEKISEDTFDKVANYYVLNQDQYIKFKPSKKSILKLLNDKSVEMKDYFSKHNFDFDNDQDLKTLFNYYNTL